MQCSVMQETQSCTGAHFAFCLPEFELEPHAFLQTGSLKTCRRLFHWSWNSTESFSGWHLVWLPPQTCQSFLPCSMVGHDEPTSIPLFRLCLQTRKLSLDGFVDQRPLFLCVIFHLHISRRNILGWIRILSHGSNSTSRMECERTSIETSLSLFLKSWSCSSCFFCSSVSTSDSCGSWETSETSYERHHTQIFNVCSPKVLLHWSHTHNSVNFVLLWADMGNCCDLRLAINPLAYILIVGGTSQVCLGTMLFFLLLLIHVDSDKQKH